MLLHLRNQHCTGRLLSQQQSPEIANKPQIMFCSNHFEHVLFCNSNNQFVDPLNIRRKKSGQTQIFQRFCITLGLTGCHLKYVFYMYCTRLSQFKQRIFSTMYPKRRFLNNMYYYFVSLIRELRISSEGRCCKRFRNDRKPYCVLRELIRSDVVFAILTSGQFGNNYYIATCATCQ